MSAQRLALATLLVRDYDLARAWFERVLGWRVVEDTVLGPAKRWLVVAPAQGGGGLLLARAATPAQDAAVGAQAAGRVAFFLHTDDFDADLARLRTHGVRLGEPAPRDEAYGRVIVFLDLYGNRWDLIGPPRRPA